MIFSRTTELLAVLQLSAREAMDPEKNMCWRIQGGLLHEHGRPDAQCRPTPISREEEPSFTKTRKPSPNDQGALACSPSFRKARDEDNETARLAAEAAQA
jgi:hypothetical protein